MNLNEVNLIGRVCRDIEIRETTEGKKLALITIATNRVHTRKADGKRIQEAEFHEVIAWGGLADIVERFVKKGEEIFVKGYIKTRIKAQGASQKEIVADNIQIMNKSSRENQDDIEDINKQTDENLF